MHSRKTLSKLSTPNLTKLANKLGVNTQHFGDIRELYIKSILERQYQILISYITCNPEDRCIVATQLKNITARLDIRLTSLEQELSKLKQPAINPITVTIQNESKKVCEALSLVNKAIDLLNDCDIKEHHNR